MKLEHKKQKVVPVGFFLRRQIKYALLAFLLVFFSVLTGMIGYHYIAGLEWWESLHMACMILTGMGPVSTIKGEMAVLFSSFYALYSGLAFLTITAVFLTPIFHRILHILQFDQNDAT